MSTSTPTHSDRTATDPAARRGARRHRPRLMVIWDVAIAAIVLGYVAAAHGMGADQMVANAGVGLAFLALGPLIIHAMGARETGTRPLGSGPTDWARLMLISATVLWIANLIIEWRGLDPDVGTFALAWPLLGTGWYAGRVIGRRRLQRSPQAAIVVGAGATAAMVVEIAARHPEHGLHVIGVVDDVDDAPPGMPPVIGGVEDLRALVLEHDVKRVIVAYGAAPDERLMAVLRDATDIPRVRFQIVPRMWDLVDHDAHIDALGNLALLEISPARPAALRNAAKRCFDVIVGSLGLAVAAPVLAVVAVLVRMDSSGAAIFRQTRIGRDGREFRMLKFRTMFVDADSRGLAAKLAEADDGGFSVGDIAAAVAEMKQADDPRITRIGRFLRTTSLDELPQLWNVVKGDMSIVGPRPLRPYEVASLTDWQRHRHDVRPGITGTWQVLGRSDITWDERMHMDYTYARNHSLRLDLRVLARTAGVVAGGKGSR